MATRACRVLVVDDDRDTAQTFAYLFVGMGHEATFLTDPGLVPETVERMKPDIIFLDIGMPTMNGWEVAKMLRKRYPHDGSLKLVAITGHADEDAMAKSRMAGFDAHLPKPVSPPLAEAIIKQFFGRR
jgi:CheY-like chemotaxis protein